MYNIYGCKSNFDTNIFYGTGSVILDNLEHSMCYGSFMKAFNSDYSNFYEVKINYLKEQFGEDLMCRTRCSTINIDYFISDDFC